MSRRQSDDSSGIRPPILSARTCVVDVPTRATTRSESAGPTLHAYTYGEHGSVSNGRQMRVTVLVQRVLGEHLSI